MAQAWWSPGPASAGLVAASLACVTYLNALTCDFVFDDNLAVLNNADVDSQGGSSWRDILVHDFWGKDLRADDSHKSYRPLTTLTFRSDHALAGGFNSWSARAPAPPPNAPAALLRPRLR